MTLESKVDYIQIILNLFLILRLFSLRLGKVYSIFAVYVLLDLIGCIAASFYPEAIHPVGYPLLYMSVRMVTWFLSFWVIYALLNAMLRSLPGILRYSRRLLHGAFAVAFLVGIIAISMNSSVQQIDTVKSRLGQAVVLTYAVDQTVGLTVLLVLVAMLAFFLWFPVVVPRNLAVFSVGYVVYFSATTVSLFLSNSQRSDTILIISILTMVITAVCYAYWGIFLSRAGETVHVRVGHRWQADEQKRLIHRLEEVNGVLLQTLASKKAV